jgi:hypothetical protein
MTPAPKAKRSPKNQPPVFKEAAVMPVSAPAVPGVPDLTRPNARLSDTQVKLLMIALWALFSVTAGIGVGRYIVQSRTPVSTESPVPVAKANLSVQPVDASQLATTASASASAIQQPSLTSASATEIRQAAAGSPQATAGTGEYQLTAATDSLLPGFVHFGRPQGNLGTAPATR